MKVIKNDDITSSMIHKVRGVLKMDTKQVRTWLGISMADIPKELQIKNRDFQIWALVDNDDILGVISFSVGKDDIIFIKMLYIVEECRKLGYAKKLLEELLEVYPKVDCTINEGNVAMYKLAKSVGIRRHKPSPMITMLSGNDNHQSRCFSNYLDDNEYVK